ncbi:MAG: histidine--tRNA ligase [Sphaerochaetaceae bacterium]
MIQSKILKGFRDSLPAQEIVKKKIIDTLEKQFSLYGFSPIDTPALEYTEVLLGKGGGETDKQIFHFADNGGRDVALRFDLTVPFARFMALHRNELTIPFKRYHINKVWRGENPQKGRFREFYQCDFDIVGPDNPTSDVEILMMMYHSLKSLQLSNVSIHIAHRGLFNAFLRHLHVDHNSVEILRTVDKIRKVGVNQTLESLNESTGSEKVSQDILSFITPVEDENPYDTIRRLSVLAGGEEEHSNRLRDIYSTLKSLDMADNIIIDPSITRGLDYYTGIVYETFLTDLPSIGSICSGGRYNDLASLYMKEKLPGVGSSIGLDRLIAALEELGSPFLDSTRSSDVIIFNTDNSHIDYYQRIALRLRELGVRVDLYLEKKKITSQFKYAQAHNIPFGIFISDEEKSLGQFTLRRLSDRTDFKEMQIESAAVKIGEEV